MTLRRWKTAACGLSWQAARSRRQPDLGDVGEGGKQPRQGRDVPVLPDGAGSVGEMERCTGGTGVVKLLKMITRSNLADMAWIGGAYLPRSIRRWGTLGAGRSHPVREAAGKVYGVSAARPQGQSRAPHPSSGHQ